MFFSVFPWQNSYIGWVELRALRGKKLPDLYHRQNFEHIFVFPNKPQKSKKIVKTYRNPIFLAKEYKQMIDSGEVRNQAELARKLGISRARITQMLNLLKLNPSTIKKLENLDDQIIIRIEKEMKFYC